MPFKLNVTCLFLYGLISRPPWSTSHQDHGQQRSWPIYIDHGWPWSTIVGKAAISQNMVDLMVDHGCMIMEYHGSPWYSMVI